VGWLCVTVVLVWIFKDLKLRFTSLERRRTTPVVFVPLAADTDRPVIRQSPRLQDAVHAAEINLADVLIGLLTG